MVKVVILLERQRKLCWGSAAICSNCMPGIKYIAMHCIYQNQRKLFAFLMFMFLARTEKEEIEYCALTVEKEKTSVTSPMKVTIGPETIVITNLCHYRHFHHHHIPL